MSDKVLIIDGNSLINRAFYAIRHLTNKEGTPTNGVYGFLNMLFGMIDEYDPKYVSVAFDLKGPTFRHLEYSEYKGTRKGMPDELKVQMPMLKEILDKLGIHRAELQGFEADDLIGTMATICSKNGLEVYVLTGDKDALQLANENTTVLITKKGISNMTHYTPEKVYEDFELTPMQIIDYKGLSGDASDNIPGIPSIGPKTATKLLKEFETVENLIANYEQVSNKRIRGLIEEYSQQALLSKKLATIIVDVPIELELSELEMKEKDVEGLIELYVKYGFTSFENRLKKDLDMIEEVLPTEEIHMDLNLISDIESLNTYIETIRKVDEIAFKTFYDKVNIRVDNAIGVAFSNGEEQTFVCLEDKDLMMNTLKEVFENEDIKKITFEAKKEFLIMLRYGIELKGLIFDGYIADYLVEPARSKYDVSSLLLEHLTISIKSTEDLLGKGVKKKKYADLEIDELANYGVRLIKGIYDIRKPISEKLEEYELVKLYEEVELRLIEVLASTEFEGFTLDMEVLETLDAELTEKIADITKEIYTFSGDEFNINSPKQLGVILFEKLELPVIKKTKTGYSTAHDILEKLVDSHPIVPLIMEYRTYSKLKSTYIDGLRAVVNPITGKVHSSLNQTVAITGRLSSTDPNMQNIPIRIPLGRMIRKIFIASGENTLVDADYSQIELRILAHMSSDPNLLKAFNEGIDIHTLTASQVFEVEVEDVTPTERSRAKAVNFGIIYGMSDFGLSENLHITRKMAKEYIEQYFAKYPSVKGYMDSEIAKCRDNGYVLTLLNRRRYIPEINHKNFNLRSFAERTAMNTPIQGTAADIIKIAMIDVYHELKKQGLKSKLILQVHDELIIDTHQDEIEKVQEIMLRCMEEALEISVPLSVGMSTAKSWYDSK